ncbi:unnamed protein product [Ceratitis capitata]|uniref:(Mediterranean fruit fly) hypothetical protein n=1 Tax=Ceratitis capitata TaxID=7213 RepID=A0A811V6Q4_CERCA|nr:unnamed protein product [Ceratitis capitata]
MQMLKWSIVALKNRFAAAPAHEQTSLVGRYDAHCGIVSRLEACNTKEAEQMEKGEENKLKSSDYKKGRKEIAGEKSMRPQ